MADALSVSCPTCGQKKRVGCIYIEPRAPEGTAAWIEQKARVGQPTKRPHSDRFAKARLADRVARLHRDRDRYAAEHAVSAERSAVLRANADAVTQEHRELGAWIARHGRILIQIGAS